MDGVIPADGEGRIRKKRTARTPQKDAECIRLIERTSYTLPEIGRMVGYSEATVAIVKNSKNLDRPNHRSRSIHGMGVMINGEWHPTPADGAAAIGESESDLIQALGAGAETLGLNAIAMGCPKFEAARLAARGEEAVMEREREWYVG